MGGINDINTSIGNFYCLMNTIIVMDTAHPPMVWTEIVEFDKVMRTTEGCRWFELRRNAKDHVKCVPRNHINNCRFRHSRSPPRISKRRINGNNFARNIQASTNARNPTPPKSPKHNLNDDGRTIQRSIFCFQAISTTRSSKETPSPRSSSRRITNKQNEN
jgi:hypothetical protein